MNIADGYRKIEALESSIARNVMRGDVEWARELAHQVAEVRDSMLTSDELLAAVEARIA